MGGGQKKKPLVVNFLNQKRQIFSFPVTIGREPLTNDAAIYYKSENSSLANSRCILQQEMRLLKRRKMIIALTSHDRWRVNSNDTSSIMW